MFLIERIHQVHTRKGIFDESCALCVEQRLRTEAKRPSWYGYLTAKDTTRSVVA